MRIIEAIWEKRNLGVECQEIEFHVEDDMNEATNAIKGLSAEYQAIRVPSGRTDLLLLAQTNGFCTIEMNIILSRRLQETSLPKIYKRFDQRISVRRVGDQDSVDRVLKEIESGEMFLTDKIALDPHFSAQMSGHRYACWTRDVLSRGGVLSIVSYEGEEMGFCLNAAKTSSVHDGLLGGIFSEHKNKGLGFLPIYADILTAHQDGAKTLVTVVSSNNIPVLRLHQVFGFEITGMTYILIKHC